MPHTPETRTRAYEKQKRLRREWIQANGPCANCGSGERLEIDHKDPDAKVSHTVWTWRKEKREAELAKCQVLCYKCHKKKTAAQVSQKTRGRTVSKLRKMTDKDVLKAVLMRQSGDTVRAIAIRFKVSHVTIARLTRAAMDGKNFRQRGVLLGS
jgi:hypothetical protein